MKLKIRLDREFDEEEKLLQKDGRYWRTGESTLTVPYTTVAHEVSTAIVQATELLLQDVYRK